MELKKSEERARLTIEVPSELKGGECTCSCVVCDPSKCAPCHSGRVVMEQVNLTRVDLNVNVGRYNVGLRR